jgi:hypothetical protein
LNVDPDPQPARPTVAVARIPIVVLRILDLALLSGLRRATARRLTAHFARTLTDTAH